ncbi:hypothetical protein SAMD00019534_005620 [Acytostelium subglobosum LB1]|uniref:hypothetical protein n=1 Tax=Acytostelium subglobosum LB1 TaxID=1410327 RepID=UPI000644AE21|nr:hypothetical protein SAMD00019534_005620 [Acytostelium subglobosum LB1]GAM17387.1 hypothetical protein SAMD00019534_005620 [Acytostelium subglobosum LB1]|eukprot:XP_012759449.1 hypothetical protein SAMD00019534_005620 [Acytostelium subglobosum LB1]
MDQRASDALGVLEKYINDKQKDVSAAITASKYIKNTIIGNLKNKRQFIESGAVEIFVKLLEIEKDETLLIQITSIIGSFACRLDQGAYKVYDSNAVPLLVALLSHSNPKLVESTARSLKILLSYHYPTTYIFGDEGIKLLVSLCQRPLESINEIAATILAGGCEFLLARSQSSDSNNNNNNNNNSDDSSSMDTTSSSSSSSTTCTLTLSQYQNKVHQYGGVDSIVSILLASKSKVQETCLHALELFTRDNTDISSFIVKRSPDNAELKAIIQLSRDNSPKTKLLAASCICNLYKCKVLPESYEQIIGKILPTIVRLMSQEDSIKEEAPAFIARVISENEDLQRVASECESISTLVSFLKDTSSSERLQENSLNAIAVLCSERDESRKQVTDAKVIPNIVGFLQSHNQAIRAAACRCARSLSRSIKQLRTSLYDSLIAKMVLRLLDDPSLEVRISATATVCNLVLDFSPMKQMAIEEGVVRKLADFTATTEEHQLRYNAAWALKNLLFKTDNATKELVLKELTYERLVELLTDSKSQIVIQALQIVRNLAYQDTTDLISKDNKGTQLIGILEGCLNSDVIEVLKQALFCICNIASNNEKHKETIMDSQIVFKLGDFLTHTNPEIRMAATWCICNLLLEGGGQMSRINRMKELGYDERMNMMLTWDRNEEVKTRAKEALRLFSKTPTQYK